MSNLPRITDLHVRILESEAQEMIVIETLSDHSTKPISEILAVIKGLVDRSLRCADTKTEVVRNRKDFEGLQRDAERWRGLMSAPRIRLLGTAEYGKSSMHLGVEIWGSHAHGGREEGHQALAAFADARRKDGYCSELRWLSTPDLPAPPTEES